MDARLFRIVFWTTSLLGLTLAVGSGAPALAAGYKTKNFTVSAATPQLAKEIGDQAEACRRELAILWLGQELPPWAKPCPIHAKVAPKMGAGGATSFVFDRGEVFDWKMNIQGSRERILDSVVPHEVTHTIFASHFRRPLPRWADEGACTTVENRSEVAKQERMLVEFLKTGRGIAFSEMFAMKDYPADVMPLYSQGHSLAQWLIESRGRKAFLEFLADGMQDDNWPRAVEQHYGFDGLYTMQNAWLDWVKQGRPQLTPETSPIGQLVSNRKSQPSSATLAGQPIVRMQSPDDITPVAATAAEAASSSAAGGKVTVASGSGSVYAAAAQAERKRKETVNVAPAKPSAPGPSIYDASLGSPALRR
ncbi:MAG TPA: hypothetical protein VHK01_14060 [Lacipirellulaceae bacterium]|jgi:hypothetical protein|nr:hypothetical protein [Lacipirellulaceae bacterium]